MASTDQISPELMHVLVVEDTALLRKMCQNFLSKRDYQVHLAKCGDDALSVIQAHHIDIILLDIGLPDVNGLDLMTEIKQDHQDIEIIVMTAKTSVENAVEAMRLGACDFIAKPIDYDHLDRSLRIAGRTRALKAENHRLRTMVDDVEDFDGLVGESQAMSQLKKIISRAAPTDEICLITGENGTGKEVVARVMHRLSKRRDQPFIAVNCGALTESLIESELFGHVKGAFSGADHPRLGCFRQAESGTIFLDEIGDMPVAMQVKLLRALETAR